MRSKKGIITSIKQAKTIVATVQSYKTHPKYFKRFSISRKYHIDNPENKAFEVGEEITFYETRPLSKLKRWTIVPPKPSK